MTYVVSARLYLVVLVSHNFCDPQTRVGNMSYKEVGVAPSPDLGYHHGTTCSPKAHTILPVPQALHLQPSDALHHDAILATAPLFHASRSFPEAGSQP